MAPALGRRTPQQVIPEGRPKRQAVLNRKDNVEIAKGNGKKEAAKKEEPKSKAKEPVKPPAAKAKGKASAAKKKEPARKSPRSKRTTRNSGKESEGNTEEDDETQTGDDETQTEDDETQTEDTEDTQGATEEDNTEQETGTENESTGSKGKKATAKKKGKVDNKKGKVDNKKKGDKQKNSSKEDKDSSSSSSSSSSDGESIPDDGALDDDDSDFDPNDDPEKLWCFCKKPHGNRFMICCDTCEDWFHGDCVGISMGKGREMEKTGEEWCCRLCKENAAKKAANDRNTPITKSALNTPISKINQNPPPDPKTLSKARSVSLDSLKNNLGKKIKDRHVSLPDKPDAEKTSDDVMEVDGAHQKANHADEKHNDKKGNKRRESVENSLFGLLTFDHIPAKKVGKEESPRKLSTERRQSLEERKRKELQQAQSKPQKVRTTPTPKNMEPLKTCHREECTKAAMKGSIYCSRECIYRYSNDCIKHLENERRKNAPSEMISKGSTVISAAQSTTEAAQTESSQERIAVYEKATGKIVAGVMAPTKKYLFAWLEENPTYQVLLKSGKQELKNPKKNQDEIVRGNVRKTMKEVLAQRCKDSQTAINIEAVGYLCKKIEQELLKLFGETNNKYRTKYRSLIFNLKDANNKVLYKRVVSGEITPNRLVSMTPEQLAAPELAAWREHETKHDIEMIKKREAEDAEVRTKFGGIKKTHKGEIEVDEESMQTLETKIEPEHQPDRKGSVTEETENPVADLLKDTTEEHSHHLFDSNCKICTGIITPPGETQVTGVSTTVIQAVPESSVPSPAAEDDLSVLSSPHSPEDSTIPTTPTTPTSPVGTRVPPSARKQPSVWRGFVSMQKVAKFVCTAYAVSGKCESLMEILPDTIHVCGRIPPNQVWEYLAQLKEGRKNYKYIDVIRFEMSSDEEKAGYIKLYTYFYTRQRIGVVANCYSGVKDMYILPLASHDPIPDELKPLPGLPKPRPHLLVGIIVRLKANKKAAELTIDSSPEISIPKKKKKKKKEKEQLEKEKIEIEAQKKLIDIIFKNRSAELSTISTAAAATSVIITEPGTSKESGLVVDPVSLLRSITSGSLNGTPGTPTKPMEVEESVPKEQRGGELPLHDPNEEEQLRLMKEQQAEIEQLKAKLSSDSNQDGSADASVNRESTKIDIPKPEEIAQSLQDTINKGKPQSDTDDSVTASTHDVAIPDPEKMAKSLEEVMKLSKPPSETPAVDGMKKEEEHEDMSEEILREALQRTKQSEKEEEENKFKDGPKIPLLGGSTAPSSSTAEETQTKPSYSSTPSIRSILARDKTNTSHPSDDDYVMNLIENIEIPVQGTPKLPLDILKGKKNEVKMPVLPAIDLPSPADLASILTAVPPQVPLPPNIKLPPGVPFPPLPPPPPTNLNVTERSHYDSTHPKEPSESRHGYPPAGWDDHRRPANQLNDPHDHPRSTVDQQRNLADHPRSLSDHQRSHPDHLRSHPDHSRRHPDHPINQPDQPRSHLGDPRSHTDHPRNHLDDPRNHADHPRNHPDVPRSHSNYPRGHPDHPRGHPDDPRGVPNDPRSHPEHPKKFPEDPRGSFNGRPPPHRMNEPNEHRFETAVSSASSHQPPPSQRGGPGRRNEYLLPQDRPPHNQPPPSSSGSFPPPQQRHQEKEEYGPPPEGHNEPKVLSWRDYERRRKERQEEQQQSVEEPGHEIERPPPHGNEEHHFDDSLRPNHPTEEFNDEPRFHPPPRPDAFMRGPRPGHMGPDFHGPSMPGPRPMPPQGARPFAQPERPSHRFTNLPRFQGKPRFDHPGRFENQPRFQQKGVPNDDFHPPAPNSMPRPLMGEEILLPSQFENKDHDQEQQLPHFDQPPPRFDQPLPRFDQSRPRFDQPRPRFDQQRPRFHTRDENGMPRPPFRMEHPLSQQRQPPPLQNFPPFNMNVQRPRLPIDGVDPSANNVPENINSQSNFNDRRHKKPPNDNRQHQRNNKDNMDYKRDRDNRYDDRSYRGNQENNRDRYHFQSRKDGDYHHDANRKRRHSETSDDKEVSDTWGRDRPWHNQQKHPSRGDCDQLEDGELP